MKNSTRFLIRASTIGIFFLVVGYGYETYTDNAFVSALSRCQQEMAADSSVSLTVPPEHRDSVRSCNFFQLEEIGPHRVTAPNSVHGELMSAYRSSMSQIPDYLYVGALIFLMIGALPTLWYFALARLSEVAAAVRRD